MIAAMPRKSSYSDLNEQMGGQLPAYLRTRRKRKLMSFDDIAYFIRQDYDAEVSGETIRRWIYQLDIDTPRQREES